MVVILRKRGIDIEIVNADRLTVLCQLDVIQVCALLVKIVNHDQVVDDLHLVQAVTLLYTDTLRVLEVVVRLQLMNVYLARIGTQMQHDCLVVEARDEELVLTAPVKAGQWLL